MMNVNKKKEKHTDKTYILILGRGYGQNHRWTDKDDETYWNTDQKYKDSDQNEK